MKKTEQKKRPAPATFFSVEFKRKIVTEYLESDLTKREILDKYGIKSNSAIQDWMRKFGITDPYGKKDYLGLPNTNRLKKKKPDLSEVELENFALNKRIKELEKLLGEEKLRSEMFSRVIEIAEKDLKLNIRKKSDTK
jgi:transposase-like protein